MSFKKEIRDLVGDKFNRLTVLKPIKKHDRTYLVCECECGNTKEIKMSHLKSGRTKSCGCLNVEKLKERKGQVSKLLKPDNYSAKYRLYKAYEKHAIERNYDFKIDFDFFVEITSQNCTYCNSQPNKTIKARQSRSKYIYNGIDRSDNDLGYTERNCVPCCTTCNIAKSTQSKEDFLSWIAKVAKHSRVPFETPSGPTIMFDVDDTLICWDTPSGYEDKEIKIDCEGIVSYRVPNHYNINLLKKMYESGHVVILWSGSGVRWCKAIAKTLNLTKYVHGYQSKPAYYIDDKANPKEWIGKHGYFDMEGNRIHGDNLPNTKENK